MTKTRCAWVTEDPLYVDYHDNYWGRPLYDSKKLFALLMLEGMQAGLSWLTILKKWDALQEHFDNFDPVIIAGYSSDNVEALMQNPAIIRHRLKIQAVISNAKAYLHVEAQGESFSDYLWHFVDGKPIQNHWTSSKQVPANTPLSDIMAKSLKQKGFKFVGSTICYAFMQAAGLVNDHTCDCYRYLETMKGKTHAR